MPLIGGGVSHMEVVFTSGYGHSADDIPKSILHAILLVVTNFGEHRGDQPFTIWNSAVESLLAPYRVEHFE